MIFIIIFSLGLFGPFTPDQVSISTNSREVILFSIDKNLSEKRLDVIRESLESYYQYDVKVWSPVIISSEDDTLYSREIMDELIQLEGEGERIIIAVTDRRLMLRLDEHISRLIRGYTEPNHNVILISTHLFQTETNSEKDLNFNLAKLAKHKIGHLLGLHHCEFSDKCFMVSTYPDPTNFYNSGHELCSKCKESLNLSHLRDRPKDKSDSLD